MYYFIKDFIPVWNTYLLQKKNRFFSRNFCSKYARTCLKALLDYATAE